MRPRCSKSHFQSWSQLGLDQVTCALLLALLIAQPCTTGGSRAGECTGMMLPWPPWKAPFWQRLDNHTVQRRAWHDRGSAQLQHAAAVQLISLLIIHPCSQHCCISWHDAAKTHPQVLPTKLELSVQFCLNLQHYKKKKKWKGKGV